MTALHVYFAIRNQQAFQRLLDASRAASTPIAPSLSSSGSRSWKKPSALTKNATPPCDVNARDSLGRTVLHLSVSSLDPAALEYVKLLFTHPRIDVNAMDSESRWTPLHRALYVGNLAACVLLLQRADIDTSLKDFEGYTAFDLYNSTVEGTKPDESEATDLFTWGTNRNAALGLSDGNDRIYPDQVAIPPQKDHPEPHTQPLSARFQSIRVSQIAMAKLHTAVVTIEPHANLRVCGFGNGGRLGPVQHTQYRLASLKDLTAEVQIVSVALGQDHTLALTRTGGVLSWGLGRFAQLGYALEGAVLQAVPRRVVGPLKKEFVKGVAACRTASACWTATELYTWGTNGGQLGYDRTAQPVQVLPRRVTQITQPVLDVALSDAAMACLLKSQDVLCFWNGRNFKINFPTQCFPSEIQAYRPPMAQNNADIAKVVSCQDTFAALSSNGEMFTFTLNPPPSFTSSDASAAQQRGPGGSGAAIVKPQRVWALRKQFSAVRDVALGADGAIVLCTESGHVYVRSRAAKGFRFQKVPFVQRVVRVAASSAGAFAALRADCTPAPIEIFGNAVADDLRAVQPYFAIALEEDSGRATRSEPPQAAGNHLLSSTSHYPRPHSSGKPRRASSRTCEMGLEDAELDTGGSSPMEDAEDESEDESIRKDVETTNQLLDLLMHVRRREEGKRLFEGVDLKHGADLFVQIGSSFEFPAHRVILASRSSVLKDVLLGKGVKHTDGALTISIKVKIVSHGSGSPTRQKPLPKLVFTGVHPLTVLLLAVYLYTDDVPAVWDRRVGMMVAERLARVSPKVGPAELRSELRALAKLLRLPALDAVLAAPVKRAPAPCMARDMQALFDGAQPKTCSDTAVFDAGGSGKERRIVEWQYTRASASSRTVFDSSGSDKDISGSIGEEMALPDPLASNIVLELADARVYCHSTILRARSPFFAGFFDDAAWTSKRWQLNGTLSMNLRHMRWRDVKFVMRHLYTGAGEEMFDVLDFTESVDDVLEFMFEVMDVASELLLDRLLLICSSVSVKFININNVCSVLSDATHFHATQLVESLHGYMARNMETLLESRMLDDVAAPLIKQLSAFVGARQAEKLPVTRSGVLLAKALESWADWLALQDIPQQVVPGRKGSGQIRASPRLSPVAGGGGTGSKRSRRASTGPLSPPHSPMIEQRFSPPSALISERAVRDGDEIFVMDDDVREEIPPLSLPAAHLSSPTVPSVPIPAAESYSPWKIRAARLTSRVDLRSIIAEAEGRREAHSPSGTPPGRSRVDMNFSLPVIPPRTPQKSFIAPDAQHAKMSSPWRLAVPGPGPSSSAAMLINTPGVACTSSDTPRNTPPSGHSRVLQNNQGGGAKMVTSSTLTAPAQARPSALGKGPKFAPTRQNAAIAAPMARRVSEGSGNAWAAAPVAFAPEPVRSSSVSPPSFLAIQQQQRDQGAAPAKAKKSLREIQEEEQARVEAERARQEEADFMKWWAEARIRFETQAQPGPPMAVSVPGGAKGGRKPKTARKKPPPPSVKGTMPDAGAVSQTQEQGRAQGQGEGQKRDATGQKMSRPRRAKGKAADSQIRP